jgi:hypothetical protein
MRHIIILYCRKMKNHIFGNTMKYNVKSLIGENCITLEDGERIYSLVFPELENNRDTELDFTAPFRLMN